MTGGRRARTASTSAYAPPMATSPDDEPRIAAWDRRVDWWLTGLAVLFLAAYAWQVLDTSLPPAGHAALEVVMLAIWAAFGADYLVRVSLARRRGRYVLRHLLDLALLVLPVLRPLRALRAVVAIGILNRQLRADARGRITVYVAGTVVLVGFVASLAVLDAERDAPDASLTSFGEAAWWTVTTISTVGYGDRYPVTAEGRLVAAGLMITGIALLGVVTASLASWFVEHLQRASEQVESDLEEVSSDVDRAEARLAEVLAELRAVTARLDALERERGG